MKDILSLISKKTTWSYRIGAAIGGIIAGFTMPIIVLTWIKFGIWYAHLIGF